MVSEREGIAAKRKRIKKIAGDIYSATYKLFTCKKPPKAHYVLSAREILPYRLYRHLHLLFKGEVPLLLNFPELEGRIPVFRSKPPEALNKVFELTKTHWDKKLSKMLFESRNEYMEIFKQDVKKEAESRKIGGRSARKIIKDAGGLSNFERRIDLDKMSVTSDYMDKRFRSKAEDLNEEFFTFLRKKMEEENFDPRKLGYKNWEEFKQRYFDTLYGTIKEVFFQHFPESGGHLPFSKLSEEKYGQEYIFMKIFRDNPEVTAVHEALHSACGYANEMSPLFILNYFSPRAAKRKLKYLKNSKLMKKNQEHYEALKTLKKLRKAGVSDKKIFYLGLAMQSPIFGYAAFFPEHITKNIDEWKNKSEKEYKDWLYKCTKWQDKKDGKEQFEKHLNVLIKRLEHAHSGLE